MLRVTPTEGEGDGKFIHQHVSSLVEDNSQKALMPNVPSLLSPWVEWAPDNAPSPNGES